MEEYSDCCGASRHHIFDELCADCLEHCSFEEMCEESEEDNFKTWNEAPYGEE
jgi:hypothetical protein